MTTDELLLQLRGALRSASGVRFALLFGSAAMRGPDFARDVDIAISWSTAPPLLERLRLATELEILVGRDVDVVDIDEASTLLRWEVLRFGLTIIAPEPWSLLEFKARVPIERADLEPYYQRESDGLRRVLEKVRWSESNSSATKSVG
jgi:predicted nucleotidyltransferase